MSVLSNFQYIPSYIYWCPAINKGCNTNTYYQSYFSSYIYLEYNFILMLLSNLFSYDDTYSKIRVWNFKLFIAHYIIPQIIIKNLCEEKLENNVTLITTLNALLQVIPKFLVMKPCTYIHGCLLLHPWKSQCKSCNLTRVTLEIIPID